LKPRSVTGRDNLIFFSFFDTCLILSVFFASTAPAFLRPQGGDFAESPTRPNKSFQNGSLHKPPAFSRKSFINQNFLPDLAFWTKALDLQV